MATLGRDLTLATTAHRFGLVFASFSFAKTMTTRNASDCLHLLIFTTCTLLAYKTLYALFCFNLKQSTLI